MPKRELPYRRKTFRELTPELLEEARRMRSVPFKDSMGKMVRHMGFRSIAERLGIREMELRRALDPGHIDKRYAGNKRLLPHHPIDRATIPAYVIADRDRRMNHWRDLNQLYLGDPLPGQSALDKKT